MDRRSFALSVAALIASTAASDAETTEIHDAGYRTFTAVGKEERPFQNTKEATLASHDGKGYLTHMWFGGSFPEYAGLRVRVYVDDEKIASINMKLGMGIGCGFQDRDAPWGNEFIGRTGNPSGIFNFYHIPYSTKVRVTAELPSGVRDDAAFWWIIRGVEGLPLTISGFPLPESAKLKLYVREGYMAQPFEEFDLCNSEHAGMLFQVAMAAKSESFAFLEGMMRGYFDGSTKLQCLSSGTEDYFLGTYYFNRGPYHLQQAGLTHKNSDDFTFSAYRFHDKDPILFSNGFRLTCRCGERKGKRIYGQVGTLHATTYTTYAWIYEW